MVIPLAVETLGLWSPASLKVLRHNAVGMTNRSGAGIVLAFLLNNYQYVYGGIILVRSWFFCLSALCGR